MKRQADRSRKEVEEYRVGDKVLISTKYMGEIREFEECDRRGRRV